jgi:hypothetical protein
MVEKMAEWSHRVHFSSERRTVGLAWGSEYWDLKAEHYRGWESLRDRLKALGGRPSKREIALDLSTNLLNDVVVAAGGVEYAVLRLRVLKRQIEREVRRHKIVPTPGIPHGYASGSTIEAAYAFADLLTWMRAVVERLERPSKVKGIPNQGLVPALRPKRLRKRAEELLDDLKSGPVGHTRNLANFTLHSAMLRSPQSGVDLEPSGRARLPIPDTPSRPVDHWLLLEWQQGRDGFEVAEELWRCVQTFVDDLLDAFENAVPRRFLRP